MSKVTMAELARRAELDVSTVSRALSGSPRVRVATRERVRALADELGYEVNAAARNLRQQAARTLGVVVPIDPARGQTISDPFYLEMLGAVSDAAARRDYDLLLTIPQSDERVAEDRLLRSGKADGLIVIGQAGRADRLNGLAETTDRFVVWGGQVAEARYTVIGSDNVGGARAATEHLLSRGRRRVLFVGDPALPEVALRRRGLEAAHAARGLAHDPGLVLPSGFGALTTARDVARFWAGGPAFDAVLAASDVLALAAMNALRGQGADVPGDVAVVGYDDVSAAALAAPPLTTVRQDIANGGRLMVETLLAKIEGRPTRSITTTTTLVVRASS